MKITLSKSQWELVGKKAGWMKTAQVTGATSPAAKQIVMTLNKIQSQMLPNNAGQARALINQLVGLIDTDFQQQQGQGAGQQQQPVQQTGQQYSLSKSEQWANSTKDPNIMDYVAKVNGRIQSEGTQRSQAILNIIMKAMSGDQSALQQLRQKSGGQAIPI